MTGVTDAAVKTRFLFCISFLFFDKMLLKRGFVAGGMGRVQVSSHGRVFRALLERSLDTEA